MRSTSQLVVPQGVASTLVLSTAALLNLVQLFCQIQLQDGTVLQPSQVMNLSNPAPSARCTSSLVDRTRSCAQPYPAARESAGKTPHRTTPPHLASKRAADEVVPSATPPEMAAGLPVGLYVVVGVIVLFVVVIISLTVVVVLLYRKKCGRVEVTSHVGEGWHVWLLQLLTSSSPPSPFISTLVGEGGAAAANTYGGFDMDR